ncbi:MAG TPA: alpha/beta hydrolase [Jatrophihabitans sp.]|nr:alpha/beta hydrolase [Jatrophihabitans sp.]
MTSASQLNTGSARRLDFEVSGQRIAALQAGPDGGRPALLVPGYTGSKEDFGPILDQLAAHGLLITAIDMPGQLDSPALSDSAEYDPDGLAGFVRAVAQLVGDRILLLGHSFGGLVARAAVIGAPDQFESLVLLGSGPARLGGARRAIMDRLDPVLASAGLPAVYAALQSFWQEDPRYVAPPPDVATFLDRRFLSGTPAMLKGMADALRHEPDRVAELAATRVPVLVTHGADDDAWPPPVQQEMAQRLGAQYAVIPAAAHSPAVENPAATADTLLSFWSPARPTD